jgi:hypothetical protein
VEELQPCRRRLKLAQATVSGVSKVFCHGGAAALRRPLLKPFGLDDGRAQSRRSVQRQAFFRALLIRSYLPDVAGSWRWSANHRGAGRKAAYRTVCLPPEGDLEREYLDESSTRRAGEWSVGGSPHGQGGPAGMALI